MVSRRYSGARNQSRTSRRRRRCSSPWRLSSSRPRGDWREDGRRFSGLFAPVGSRCSLFHEELGLDRRREISLTASSTASYVAVSVASENGGPDGLRNNVPPRMVPASDQRPEPATEKFPRRRPVSES